MNLPRLQPTVSPAHLPALKTLDERELLAEIARFRLVVNHVPAWIALYAHKTDRCLYANRGYAEAFGLTEQSIIGKTFEEIIGKEAMAQVQPAVDKVIREHVAVSYERFLPHADGQPRWIEVHLIPQLDTDGTLLAACVLINDITKFRLAELHARETESRLQKFMHATVEGIHFHKDGITTDANPPLLALVGFSLEEVIGRPVFDFIPPEEHARVREVMQGGEETRYETQLLHRDGSRIPVEFIVRTMERDGNPERMTIVRDIRDRLASQERIYHLAHHDGLTGLLNRAAFMERMQVHLQRAQRHGERLALLFIDLDNFKRVNDSLGHHEGDQVLITVAQRVIGALRSTDLIGRFGGDEFVVLVPEIKGIGDVQVVLDALLSVVEVPVQADGRALSVTPSIGVALYPEHGTQPEELIQHADTAMYRAKARGRATYEFFETALAEAVYADLVLESELVQGLARDEFTLYFQPQVDALTGQLSGAEALLRWRHPTRGLLTPDAFIDVAEKHRLMLPLGEWVLRQAAAQARAWRRDGVAAIPIAVNLARMQFNLVGFANTVAKVLSESGAEGSWLELELTERLLIEDIEHAPSTLAALRAQGLTISVDDFGTGYTSLAHLTELPLDKLKIDQSFVGRLPEDAGAQAITRAIVQMALGLGLRVTAEGVRTTHQWQLLSDWGCQQFQGELVGAPMANDEFIAWARARARR